MAEEAMPERPVGCLGLSLPLTATIPRPNDEGSPHNTEEDPGTTTTAAEPPAPAMDGPAGSAKPLDVPETTERATAPSETTPEAGPAPASDQTATSAETGPEAVTAKAGVTIPPPVDAVVIAKEAGIKWFMPAPAVDAPTARRGPMEYPAFVGSKTRRHRARSTRHRGCTVLTTDQLDSDSEIVPPPDTLDSDTEITKITEVKVLKTDTILDMIAKQVAHARRMDSLTDSEVAAGATVAPAPAHTPRRASLAGGSSDDEPPRKRTDWRLGTTRAKTSPVPNSSASMTPGWQQAAQDRRVGSAHKQPIEGAGQFPVEDFDLFGQASRPKVTLAAAVAALPPSPAK